MVSFLDMRVPELGAEGLTVLGVGGWTRICRGVQEKAGGLADA